MNELISIYPYKKEGQWVFDDEKAGLVEEPFVAGADTVLEMFSQTIPDGNNGFQLIFSAKPFPGSMTKFDWRREEFEGNWYYSPMLDIEGWLCPALLKYFKNPPETIYASWHSKDYVEYELA